MNEGTRTVNNAPIAFIEAHDGHIDRITIAMEQSTEVSFDELMVYHQVAIEKYDVWIYRAALTMTDVSSVSVNGLLVPHVDLDDGIVVNGGVTLEWVDLLETQAATGVTISFLTGSSIEIHCSSVRLALLEPVRYLEEWLGPL
jgi:hypothetical protein